MRSAIDAALRWAVDTEGSSRSSALIRIGLALLVWTRFSEELILYKHLGWAGLAFSASYFFWTTMMLVGLASRLAVLAVGAHVFVLYFYGGYMQGNEPWTHHHISLLGTATLLCALTPCGRSYSLDRWLALRRAERAGTAPPPERGNLLGLRLIALQLPGWPRSWGWLTGGCSSTSRRPSSAETRARAWGSWTVCSREVRTSRSSPRLSSLT